jgi:hypothetical protein
MHVFLVWNVYELLLWYLDVFSVVLVYWYVIYDLFFTILEGVYYVHYDTADNHDKMDLNQMSSSYPTDIKLQVNLCTWHTFCIINWESSKNYTIKSLMPIISHWYESPS